MKMTVKRMLNIAKASGIKTLREAFHNVAVKRKTYVKRKVDMEALLLEMKELGMFNLNEQGEAIDIVDISVDVALESV